MSYEIEIICTCEACTTCCYVKTINELPLNWVRYDSSEYCPYCAKDVQETLRTFYKHKGGEI